MYARASGGDKTRHDRYSRFTRSRRYCYYLLLLSLLNAIITARYGTVFLLLLFFYPFPSGHVIILCIVFTYGARTRAAILCLPVPNTSVPAVKICKQY